MRAARAAAARGEADDDTAPGRSFKHYYSKPRTRGSSPNRRSSRPRVRLPQKPDAWGSRQAPPAPKQKRASKGSAIKRSRVHMSVAATRGLVCGHQSDAASRFPMPYPGVDCGPTQLQQHHRHHHIGHRRSPKRAIGDHSGSRRAHTIEELNHGPAGRRLRTRPRSAMALPPSRTEGSESGGVNGHRQPPKSKRKQDVSKAAVIGERDRRGGSKRLRCATLQAYRC